MGRVDGKVAFVTGAARGQGRSHAIKLAEEGADIIAVDLCAPVEGVLYPGATPDDLQETVRQVEALDRRIVTDICDVRDLEAMKAAVSKGVAELAGRLDIVVGNAGIAILTPWHLQTPEIVRTQVDINLMGVWNTVMASAPHMIEAGNGGSIVLISSANGLKAGPWAVGYNMSKFGVTGMAQSFATEFAKDNIRVNSIHPGAVNTPMTQYQVEEGSSFDLGSAENPNVTNMYTPLIPGMAEPEDISNGVLYLVSDESKWVTAQPLAIDMGVTKY